MPPFSVHFGVSSAVEVRYRCPCCGYKTLEAPEALKLCPVCWWEDDGQEDDDASEVRLTVNGQLSLKEARVNYAQFGAAHPRFLSMFASLYRPKSNVLPSILPPRTALSPV